MFYLAENNSTYLRRSFENLHTNPGVLLLYKCEVGTLRARIFFLLSSGSYSPGSCFCFMFFRSSKFVLWIPRSGSLKYNSSYSSCPCHGHLIKFIRLSRNIQKTVSFWQNINSDLNKSDINSDLNKSDINTILQITFS